MSKCLCQSNASDDNLLTHKVRIVLSRAQGHRNRSKSQKKFTQVMRLLFLALLTALVQSAPRPIDSDRLTDNEGTAHKYLDEYVNPFDVPENYLNVDV